MSGVAGSVRKMRTSLAETVQYEFLAGDNSLLVNDLLGRKLSLNFTGLINCVHCQRKINKSFNGGYCYPCFRKLAQCDTCIVSPEKCHFEAGTCREPEWGEANCNIDHVISTSWWDKRAESTN